MATDLKNNAIILKLKDTNQMQTFFSDVQPNNEALRRQLANFKELVFNTPSLQTCDANTFLKCAHEIVALDLEIQPKFGEVYIIPYGNMPQVQLGYKGWLKLARRTGLYKDIDVYPVYEGEKMIRKFPTGYDIEGQPISDKVIGYYAYWQKKDEFYKGVKIEGLFKYRYMTIEQIARYAKRYVKTLSKVSYDTILAAADKDSSTGVGWLNDFHAMARKTVLLTLIHQTCEFSLAMADAYKAEVESQNIVEAQPINEDINFTATPTSAATKAEEVEVEMVSPEEEKAPERPF